MTNIKLEENEKWTSSESRQRAESTCSALGRQTVGRKRVVRKVSFLPNIKVNTLCLASWSNSSPNFGSVTQWNPICERQSEFNSRETECHIYDNRLKVNSVTGGTALFDGAGWKAFNIIIAHGDFRSPGNADIGARTRRRRVNRRWGCRIPVVLVVAGVLLLTKLSSNLIG